MEQVRTMQLTPIHVRGKRRRPGEAKPGPGPQQPKPRREVQDRPPPGERPRKKRRKSPSLEDRLPLEVLERIFLMSENVNFARATPRLGWMLSNRNLLLELLITAFGPTWDNWFGCVSSEVASYRGYITQDAARFGGDPKFQVSHDHAAPEEAPCQPV